MKNQLEGNVAIVTGGASGIGRALGEELASRGCEVVLGDRQAELAQEVAAGVRERGGKAVGVEHDVRDCDAWRRLAADTVKRTGRIDFLFNNAGIAIGGEIDAYDVQDFDEIFDVNLRGVAYGIQAIYPRMIERGSGHIINTASVAGLVASPGNAGYAATKHAVVGLSKSLRIEAKRHGVRVSVLCPGAIRTPILTGGRFGRVKALGADEATIMKLWERARPMAPPLFARKVIDCVRRDQAIIVVPRWWKAFWYLDRVSPELSMMVWERVHASLRKELVAAGVSFERPAKPTNGQRAAQAS